LHRDLASHSIPSGVAFAMKIFHSSSTNTLTSQSEISRITDTVKSLFQSSGTNSVVIATKDSFTHRIVDLASHSIPSGVAFAMKIFHSSSTNTVVIAIDHSLTGNI
ncbi:hypothetical protein PENTCL1PPCAC_7542, partial [Pristionchus entomophagus]